MIQSAADVHCGDWHIFIDPNVADIAQPDICYIGGFTRTLAMAKRAAALGSGRSGMGCETFGRLAEKRLVLRVAPEKLKGSAA